MVAPVRIVLVRHARPAAMYEGASLRAASRSLAELRHGRSIAMFDTDPGLTPTGLAQAEAMAEALAAAGPVSIRVSPLRRTRETAVPLERRWETTAVVEPALGEIPSPAGDLAARTVWLRETLPRRWSELGEELQAWRDSVIAALTASPEDAVVVTHYVAINAAVGAATGDDRVVVFAPDYCSRTVLDVVDGRLELVERGAEAVAPAR